MKDLQERLISKFECWKTPNGIICKADAVELTGMLPNESVDMVVFDPAYESLEKYRKQGTTTRLKNSSKSSNEWFEIFPNSKFPILFGHMFRSLKLDSHLYMFCDEETRNIVTTGYSPQTKEELIINEVSYLGSNSPLLKAGFYYKKSIVWDKCFGRTTRVQTSEGIKFIKDIKEGDRVVAPGGDFVFVIGKRFIKKKAVNIQFTDNTSLIVSEDHPFITESGLEVCAKDLSDHIQLSFHENLDFGEVKHKVQCTDFIPEDRLVVYMDKNTECLWCGEEFDTLGSCAAHQKLCRKRLSMTEIARRLTVSYKTVQWWFAQRCMPYTWIKDLCLYSTFTRFRYMNQGNRLLKFPKFIDLDYDFGRFIGAVAADGSITANNVSVSGHTLKKFSQLNHVERYARQFGLKSNSIVEGNRRTVTVPYRFISWLSSAFIKYNENGTKFFTSLVYSTPLAFKKGLFDGLIDGDGRWESSVKREVFVNTSNDLAFFIHRFVMFYNGVKSTARLNAKSKETHKDHWKIIYDPKIKLDNVRIKSVEELGVCDLIDISIDHPSHQFLLANNCIVHNCCISTGYNYRAQHEYILYAEKRKQKHKRRQLNDFGIPDVFVCKRLRGKGYYPTEKPVPVVANLVLQSSNENEIILDPFCGSGVLGKVCKIFNRRYILGDLKVEEAVNRLEAEPIRA